VLIKVNNATCTDEEYMANYGMWTVNDGTGNLLVHNTAVFEYVPTEGIVYTVSGPLDYDFDEWKVQIRLSSDVQTGGGGDVTAPQILTVEAVSETVVKVQFSEDVDVTSAQTVANYSINNGITVEQAAVHSIIKSQVFLTVSTLSGGTYNLTIDNVGDLNGNFMQTPVVMPFTTSFGIGEKNISHRIGVYPNPSDGKINIEWLDGFSGIIEIKIYGIAGMEVFSKQFPGGTNENPVIDASDLESGLYILEISNGENSSRTKLMIK
jgi:hypothetical protein